MDVTKIRNILVDRTDRLGDVILALPLLPVLKRSFPVARICMLITPNAAELVQGHPDLDGIIPYDVAVSFWKLLAAIRNGNFDAAIVGHPSLRVALLMFLAGIPVRVGTGYRWYSLLFNKRVYEHRKDSKRHEVEYNLDLTRAVGCDASDVEFSFDIPREAYEVVRAVRRRLGMDEDDVVVILHPGSGGSARNWKPKLFGELGERLVTETDAKVIVTGGKSEHALVNEVTRQISHNAYPLVDELRLKELAALIQSASLFVSNSTGPIHIAATVGTPVIGLYPPIIACSPRRWGPYTEDKAIFVPDVPMECKACINEKCEYYDCMDLITVDEVFRSVQDRLSLSKGNNSIRGACSILHYEQDNR